MYFSRNTLFDCPTTTYGAYNEGMIFGIRVGREGGDVFERSFVV